MTTTPGGKNNETHEKKPKARVICASKIRMGTALGRGQALLCQSEEKKK